MAIPSSLQAQIIRRAISPRLAMRTFLKGADAKQSLPILHRLAIGNQLTGHHAGYFRLDFVHELHRLDNAEDRSGLHRLSDTYERRVAGRGSFVERPHNGRLYEKLILGWLRRL